MPQLKTSVLSLVVLLAGCSFFHRTKAVPDSPQLIITGVPTSAALVIDGVLTGPGLEGSRSRLINVAPGTHVVQVKMDDAVVYQENATVGPGEKRIITVLSGNSRN